MHTGDADHDEIVTPVDDPSQFDPAWRYAVADFMFSSGARTRKDCESLLKTGGLPYMRAVYETTMEPPGKSGRPARKGKGGKLQKTKKVTRKTVLDIRPVPPFDSHEEYRCLAGDEWVVKAVLVKDAISRGVPSVKEDAGIRLAKRWYEEKEHEAAMRKRLEPMLLTGIDMDVVTLDLMGVPGARPAFEAYERLFFNCRDENWKLNSSAVLIQRMAMPHGPLRTFIRKFESLDEDGFIIGDGRPLAKASDVWKAIGATLGYEALIYTWQWDRFAHGMKDNSVEHMLEVSWKVAVSRIFTALYTGDIAHEDAARILAAYTAQAKKISDDRHSNGSGGDDDTTKALLSILSLAAPKMVAVSESRRAERNEEIQSRIQSQLAINKTAIEDKGKAVEAEVIDAQIAEAVSRT